MLRRQGTSKAVKVRSTIQSFMPSTRCGRRAKLLSQNLLKKSALAGLAYTERLKEQGMYSSESESEALKGTTP